MKMKTKEKQVEKRIKKGGTEKRAKRREEGRGEEEEKGN